MPEVLRLNRMRIAPKAELCFHGVALGGSVGFTVRWSPVVL
jgi:hypothetical protein